MFNKKGYKFEGAMKAMERFGRNVVVTKYSHVLVHDPEQSAGEPQRLKTHYEYEELEAVPVSLFNIPSPYFQTFRE